MSNYELLAACTRDVVTIAPDRLPDSPDVVRIQGVKEKPEDRRRREAEAAEAPVTASVRTRAGTRVARYDDHVTRIAANYRIDPLFLHAVIGTESAYRPNAVSHANAIGLMQIIPTTGKSLGVQRAALFDPGTNIDAGARLLKRLQRRYGRDFNLILAGYNAGEGAVAKYGNKVPPYAETQGYVRKVMARYQTLRGGTAGAAR
ncbi:lytic transglycosylase domain-containing protein [Sphingomonas sp. MMS12-HWE2-04]|uniref:lytic transglycosylase domain-containing protein n=1 Tax=Sphingomonas sp. MMS12-HWE2-04 TaxID=3234199 RepID=UPI00385001C5